MHKDTIGTSIRRSFRWLVAATAVLYLALGGLALYAYSNSQDNRNALCALRGDLVARVQQSTNFLREHPKGAAGISAKLVLDGIHNQQRTINALHGLNCPN